MSRPVLLFDIDGTLVTSGGAGARALERAFVELAQIEGALKGITLDGATDVAIVREALTRAGQTAEPGLMERLLDRYTELLPDELARAAGYRLLEGVVPLFEELARAQRVFGLCTGNVREGARHKLERGGLWSKFASGFGGGFGSDGELRADIVRAALVRASAHAGRTIHPGEALVIGDTPRDIAAANAVGVPVLAVATGRSSVEELRSAGATFAVSSLAHPEARRILEIAP